MASREKIAAQEASRKKAADLRSKALRPRLDTEECRQKAAEEDLSTLISGIVERRAEREAAWDRSDSEGHADAGPPAPAHDDRLEDEAEQFQDYESLIHELDSQVAGEVDARRAETQRCEYWGIPAGGLMSRTPVTKFLDQIEGLASQSDEGLQAECEERGLATCGLTTREEMLKLVRDARIWEEMRSAALHEVCTSRGVPLVMPCVDSGRLPSVKRRRRSELLQLLAASTWEAYGVPVQRFDSIETARAVLTRVRQLEGCNPEELAEHCSDWGLPSASAVPSDTAARLSQAFVWYHLPADELRKECAEHGVTPEDLPRDDPTQQELYKALVESMRVQRCTARGIPVRRLESLESAEELLGQVDGFMGLDTLSLQKEFKKLGIPVPPSAGGTALIEKLKEALVWTHLSQAELQQECKEAGMASLDALIAAGNVPQRLFIVGTWNDFRPVEMVKSGAKFEYGVKVGAEGRERFQLLLTGAWETTIYPSIKDANPYVHHNILGPNDRGHGMDWSIGVHPKDKARPGDRFVVVVSFGEQPCTIEVSWSQAARAVVGTNPYQFQLHGKKPGPLQGVPPRSSRSPWGRPAVVRELFLRRERMLEWERLGVPVEHFSDYQESGNLVEQYRYIEQLGKQELVDWYKGTGFPDEQRIERAEIVAVMKRVSTWDTLPLAALVQACRGQKLPAEVADPSGQKDQRNVLIDRLLVHDRMCVWEAEGFQAHRIGDVDRVISAVAGYERFHRMDDAELRRAYVETGLPKGVGTERDALLKALKKLVVWAVLPLPELQLECKLRGLEDPAAEDLKGTDEEQRHQWIQHLRVDTFRSVYEAKGVPVARLGTLRASRLAALYDSLDDLTTEELRVAYEGNAQFMAPNMSRQELVGRVRDMNLWVSLPMPELWAECKQHGIPLCGFDPAAPEKELRPQLVDRLLLRTRVAANGAAKRAEGAVACGHGGDAAEPAHGLYLDSDAAISCSLHVDYGQAPHATIHTDPAASKAAATGPQLNTSVTVAASELPEVWRYIEHMREPIMSVCVCHVERKTLPKDIVLPAEAKSWPPLEAALCVLSGLVFDPRQKQAWRPDPSSAAGHGERDRLISVTCPTSEKRQHFHPLLYETFRIQDYEPKELVIVDTGTKPSPFFEEQARKDPRIVYRFYAVEDLREGCKTQKKAWSLGLKRNIACCLARGAALAHFDDDDLYAPGYLSWMWSKLGEAIDTATGERPKRGLAPAAAKLTEWHLLDISSLQCRYLDVAEDKSVPTRERRGWLYGWGFSYVFTRTAWEQAPFPDVEFAEDIGFLEGLMARAIPVYLAPLPKAAPEQPDATQPGLVAHSFHPGSTSGGEFDGFKRCGRLTTMPPVFAKLLPLVKQIQHRWAQQMSKRSSPVQWFGTSPFLKDRLHQHGLKPSGPQQGHMMHKPLPFQTFKPTFGKPPLLHPPAIGMKRG